MGQFGTIARAVLGLVVLAVAAQADPPALDPASLTDPAALQRRLAERGHDPGPADGRPGPATRQALMAFQAAACLPPTGEADPATRAALGAAEAPACPAARLPGWLTADTPLRPGVYVAPPLSCDDDRREDDPFSPHLRIVQGRTIHFGTHVLCETRRTDIEAEATRFSGRCAGGPDWVTASWVLDLASPEGFTELRGMWDDTAGAVFARCADASPQARAWAAWRPLDIETVGVDLFAIHGRLLESICRQTECVYYGRDRAPADCAQSCAVDGAEGRYLALRVDAAEAARLLERSVEERAIGVEQGVPRIDEGALDRATVPRATAYRVWRDGCEGRGCGSLLMLFVSEYDAHVAALPTNAG